jgi:FG-GAP repeat
MATMSDTSGALRGRVATSFRRGLVTIASAGVLVLLVALVPATSASATTSARPASPKVQSTPRGTLLASLGDPTATKNDEFGVRTAIAGTTMIVGDPGVNSTTGAAYIYEKGPSGWPTTPTVTLTDPAATAGDEFGFGVAVATRGTTVIVGAPGTSTESGAAYIYVEGTNGWPTTPTVTLTDPGATSGDDFGFSVAISRFTAMTAVVGAVGVASDEGAAYIYVDGASRWPSTPNATLTDPGTAMYDLFGFSVAVSSKTVVVGAPGLLEEPGAAYIYVNSGSGWPTSPTTTLSEPGGTPSDLGYSVSVSGTTLVVGDPASGTGSNGNYPGAAYIFVNTGSGWPTTPVTTLPYQSTLGDFGYAVSVSEGIAVVSAPATSSDTGAAYFYVEVASQWPTSPTTTLSDPGATTNDEFGVSVAVSASAKTAVVGAPGTSSDEGAAYIYKA